MSENTSPAQQKRPLGKIIWIIGGVLLLLLASAYFIVNAVADKRWGEMKVRMDSLLAETKARDASRPVLRGEAIPGNAWDDYAPAVDAVKDIDHSVVGDFVGRSKKADAVAAKKIVEQHTQTVDRMRQGTRRSKAEYPYVWEEGLSSPIPSLLASNNLANIAVCQARFLAEDGKTREAVEILLDVCQFGRDTGHNGVLISAMISVAICDTAFDELRDLVLSRALTPEDLLVLERGLEVLDRSFAQLGPCYLNDHMSAGLSVMSPLYKDTHIKGTWNYAFSYRLMVADAMDAVGGWIKHGAAQDNKPWSEVQSENKRIEEEVAAMDNVIVQIAMPGLARSQAAWRKGRAQLRLLRTAVHHLATGTMLELDDPFGNKILHSKDEKGVKFWSVGPDGADDRGRGNWKGQDPGQDIVLEITTK